MSKSTANGTLKERVKKNKRVKKETPWAKVEQFPQTTKRKMVSPFNKVETVPVKEERYLTKIPVDPVPECPKPDPFVELTKHLRPADVIIVVVVVLSVLFVFILAGLGVTTDRQAVVLKSISESRTDTKQHIGNAETIVRTQYKDIVARLTQLEGLVTKGNTSHGPLETKMNEMMEIMWKVIWIGTMYPVTVIIMIVMTVYNLERIYHRLRLIQPPNPTN